MTEQPHTDGYTIVTEYRVHDQEWAALIYKGTGPDAVDLSNYQASKYARTEYEALERAQTWIEDEQKPKRLGNTYHTTPAGVILHPEPAPDPANAA